MANSAYGELRERIYTFLLSMAVVFLACVGAMVILNFMGIL